MREGRPTHFHNTHHLSASHLPLNHTSTCSLSLSHRFLHIALSFWYSTFVHNIENTGVQDTTEQMCTYYCSNRGFRRCPLRGNCPRDSSTIQAIRRVCVTQRNVPRWQPLRRQSVVIRRCCSGDQLAESAVSLLAGSVALPTPPISTSSQTVSNWV